jgi:hypothetical protein
MELARQLCMQLHLDDPTRHLHVIQKGHLHVIQNEHLHVIQKEHLHVNQKG